MDARTIDNLEQADTSAETRQCFARWRDIVRPGIYRQSGGRWKKCQESKFLRIEKRVIEEQLQQAIRNIEDRRQQKQAGDFNRKVEGKNEQWTGESRRQTRAFNKKSPILKTTTNSN